MLKRFVYLGQVGWSVYMPNFSYGPVYMIPPSLYGTVNKIPLVIQTLMGVYMISLLSRLGGILARSAEIPLIRDDKFAI